MEQWQGYSETPSANRPAQYRNNSRHQPQSSSQEAGGPAVQQQGPIGGSYEAYQRPTTSSRSQSIPPSPAGVPRGRVLEHAGDGDLHMQDADPYNRTKYSTRSTPSSSQQQGLAQQQQQHLPRAGGMYLSQEESLAGQRYSPMDTRSPSSPYASTAQQSIPGNYTSYTSQGQSNRQSPTRGNANAYASPPNAYYTSARELTALSQTMRVQVLMGYFAASRSRSQQPLPPIQLSSPNGEQEFPPSATAALSAVFGHDVISPRHRHSRSHDLASQGQVPKFAQLKSLQDLQPNVNSQPAFRRANPEGGFISVSQPDLAKTLRSTDLLIRSPAHFSSHCKRSQHISLRLIEYAIRASSTNHPEIPDVS